MHGLILFLISSMTGVRVAKETAHRQNNSGKGSLLAQTRGILRRFDLKARKSLGQHFLIDRDVLERIVASAELTAGDIVVEIGPGLGVLTGELAEKAGMVVAVELDGKLAAILGEKMASRQNVIVVNRNILEVEPASLLEGLSLPENSSNSGYKVVANLPYYITSAVIRHFLESELKPKTMVVMVQKEVAEAIVAEPGGMSLLSVSVQFYGKPRIISSVPAEAFYPPPEVDSAILRVDISPQPVVAVDDERTFFELVRAGFTAPRKQIANSLSQGLAWTKLEALSLLEKAEIAPQRRAETLSVDEWARLWHEFMRVKEIKC